MGFNFYTNVLEGGKPKKGPVIGDPYFYQTREETEKWLNEKGIVNYLINDDLTVDVHSKSVFLRFGKDENKLFVKFNDIEKDFTILINSPKNPLSSLKGCPEKVRGNFNINFNGLSSLEYCPKEVGGYFSCSNNKLISLLYCPVEVGGSFECNNNKLISLEYCPKRVGASFFCSGNKLTSLEHSPNLIKGTFSCSDNKLTSLKGCPERIEGDFYCNDNKLNSFEYYPIAEGEQYIYDNPIKTLKGLQNINPILLIKIINNYPKVKWTDINWDGVDIDELVLGLREISENENVGEDFMDYAITALKRIEELQLY